MSFLRIKTVTKNGKTYKYLVRQTNVRRGEKSLFHHGAYLRIRHGGAVTGQAWRFQRQPADR